MPINSLSVYFLGLLKGIFERESRGEILCVNEASLIQRLAKIGIDMEALQFIIEDMSAQVDQGIEQICQGSPLGKT